MTVSVVFYLGYRGGGGGGNYSLYQIYLFIPLLAEILFWLLLKQFFSQWCGFESTTSRSESGKELNDRKIKKLNRLIAKM